MRDSYFDIPAMSNSALKWFKKSPMHYQWYINNPPPPSKEMAFGSAFHTIILEPEKFKYLYVVADTEKRPEKDKGMTSNKNKAWLAGLGFGGKEILKKEEFDTLQRIRDAVMKNGFAKELVTDSKNQIEQGIYWEHNDIQCKGKVDILNSGFMADLKTCADASPNDFSRTIWNYEYYRQAGMYLDGYGMQTKPFYFIAVEKTEPFGVSVHKCSQDVIDYGIQEYQELIAQYKMCLESGNWPGYEKDAIYEYFEAELPKWVKKAEGVKHEVRKPASVNYKGGDLPI